jgi:hypothetical protein
MRTHPRLRTLICRAARLGKPPRNRQGEPRPDPYACPQHIVMDQQDIRSGQPVYLLASLLTRQKQCCGGSSREADNRNEGARKIAQMAIYQ